jgi:hypothetical protein
MDRSQNVTRRDFIKKSAAASGTAIGMATLGVPMKPVLGTYERIRFSIYEASGGETILTGEIANSEKANEFLHYEYRKPWKL